MADDSNMASSSRQETSDGSDIKISVKTLDSEIYAFSVKKNLPILRLKEMIVEATGIPVQQQRLIFRGKVLRDDQLLSEYKLEDGYTLHLVARRPEEGGNSASVSTQADANSNGNNPVGNTQRNRAGQRPSAVILGVGSINHPVHGERNTTDISREIAEVLRTQGAIDNILRVSSSGETGMSQNNSGNNQPGNSAQPGFAYVNQHTQPHHMVIPDSLTTLLELIARMDRTLQQHVEGSSSSSRNDRASIWPGDARANYRGIPTPQALAAVIERAMQLLTGSASSAFSRFAQHMQREAASTDLSVRSQVQNEAIQMGVMMQHLGAVLIELGRATMMLRMGQSPSESFVNCGPAVYVNPTGANPIMVQPSVMHALDPRPSGGAHSRPFGGADSPPNISIHVHTGSAAAARGPSSGLSTSIRATSSASQQNVVQAIQAAASLSNSTTTTGQAPRTVAAVIPAHSATESPVVSLIVPLQINPGILGQGLSTVNPHSATNHELPSGANNVIQPVASVQACESSSGERSVTSGAPVATTRVLTSSSVQLGSSLHPTEQHVMTGTASASTSVPDASITMVSRADAVKTEKRTDEMSSSSVGSSIASRANNQISERPTSSSGQSSCEQSTPIGLLGGLQPKVKKRSKINKSAGSSAPSSGSLAIQTQQNTAVGLQTLQSLISQSTGVNQSNSHGSTGPSPSARQFVSNTSPGTQPASGPAGIGGLLSNVLRTPAFDNVLTSLPITDVTEQTGSPADLRNMMELLAQNPGIVTIFNNILQEGGLDISSMVQQVMPLVSQVLGGGSDPHANADGAENDGTAPVDSSDGHDSQIDLNQACQSIENSEPPHDVFRAVLGSAERLNGADDDIQHLAQDLGDDPNLANDYMNLLQQEARQKLQSESKSEPKPDDKQ